VIVYLQGSPQNCNWNGASCNLTVILHIISNGGFCLLLSIPPLMWSEIIQGRVYDKYSTYDWCSCANQFDMARSIVVVCICIYFIVQIINIAGLVWSLDTYPHDSTHFLGSQMYFDCLITESCTIMIQIISWLFVSLKLQCYVLAVKFDKQEQRRILRRINTTLCVLCACYFFRAYMLFIYPYDRKSAPSGYLPWVLMLYWLPYILCSWLLVGLMIRRERPRQENIVKIESSLNKAYGELDVMAIRAIESSHNSIWDGDAELFPVVGNTGIYASIYEGHSPGRADDASTEDDESRTRTSTTALSADYYSSDQINRVRMGIYYEPSNRELLDNVSLLNSNSERGSYRAPNRDSAEDR
jgi:hypothetical protein